MKKILVPTDFSANAKKAMTVAASIAQKNGADVLLLHTNTAAAYVSPLPEYYTAEQYDMSEYYENAASELYKLKQEVSAQYGNVSIETRVEEGFLYDTIARIAQEEGVDLVVMGTKGATGTLEFFLGSNTEKVIRTAPCMVLAVPESSGDFNPARVVLASTLKPEQSAAFEALAAWQKYQNFEVLVLYLNNPTGFNTEEEVAKAAEDMAKANGLENVSAYVSGNTFSEEESIVQFAAEREAGMIAMATHQRKGLSHLLFGSLTEDTANHSDIPVLSIPIRKK